MMIIVGTSSVHMMLGEKEVAIKGSSGTVKDGIMPGYFGYEAGQSCVGDHFAWFVENRTWHSSRLPVPLSAEFDCE